MFVVLDHGAVPSGTNDPGPETYSVVSACFFTAVNRWLPWAPIIRQQGPNPSAMPGTRNRRQPSGPFFGNQQPKLFDRLPETSVSEVFSDLNIVES